MFLTSEEVELLQQLHPGDKVLRVEGTSFNQWQTVEVVRVTKAQVVVGRYEQRFWKKNGKEVGGYAKYIVPPTEQRQQEAAEAQAEAEHRRQKTTAIVAIRNARLHCLPLETLEQIAALIVGAASEEEA